MVHVKYREDYESFPLVYAIYRVCTSLKCFGRSCWWLDDLLVGTAASFGSCRFESVLA